MDKCPICGEVFSIENIPVKSATKYEDCIKKCTHCMLGLSNAKTNPTIIYKNYKDNIPKPLHDKLDEILKLSLNQASHEQKIIRIGFNTSEDALSWIFFAYFIKNDKIDILFKLLNFDNENVIDIYFWGVSYKEPSLKNIFRKELIDILETKFNETEKYYSEPDIIIETKTKIIFIEVKYKSSNSYEKSQKKIKNYLSEEYYSDIKTAQKSLLYELVRNWSIGNEIAKGKEYYLLNIGLKRKFDYEDHNERIKFFKDSLHNKNNFVRINWEKIMENIKKENVEKYFIDEMEKRIFIKANGHFA
jgi:hypothetical protein